MEHKFGLHLTLPITSKQADQLLVGKQRMTFRKIDPFSDSVETGIGCVVCLKSGNAALNDPICPGAPAAVEAVQTVEEVREAIGLPPKEDDDGTMESN